jgi:hypothetical protein
MDLLLLRQRPLSQISHAFSDRPPHRGRPGAQPLAVLAAFSGIGTVADRSGSTR